jgi:hypothetical protein
MTNSNDFSKLYKTISNSELLSILDNSSDYQPLAVEAAKQEFANRRLSDEEIQTAKASILDSQMQQRKRQQKVKEIQDKIKSAWFTNIEAINPVQPQMPSTEKTIRLVVIVFSILFFYKLIKDFNTHLAWLNDIIGFPLGSFLDLFPIVLLPLGAFSFWKKKKIGWTLLIIFLTFSAVETVWMLIQSFTWKTPRFVGLDNLFPRPNPATFIIQLFFSIGALYVLCKENIREVFCIDRQKAIMTIGLTAFATLILIFLIS